MLRVSVTHQHMTLPIVQMPQLAGGDGIAVTNGLRLADRQVMLATIRPGEALDPSGFEPLRTRIVQDGVAGDWLAHGTPLGCRGSDNDLRVRSRSHLRAVG